MKTTNSLIVFIILIIILAYSCQSKEEEVITQDAGNLFVDPVNDLVACTDPFTKTLYIVKEHEREILNKLDAEHLENGKYRIVGTTLSGKKAPFIFSVKYATPSQIFFYTSRDEANALNLIADRDPERGEILARFTDRLGIFYRTYKNAQCTQINDTFSLACSPEFGWVTDNVGDTIKYYRRTGRYFTLERNRILHCLKGNDYCTEALIVFETEKFYGDPECRQHIETNDHSYKFSCLP